MSHDIHFVLPNIQAATAAANVMAKVLQAKSANTLAKEKIFVLKKDQN
jgi:hypothetical protein